MKTAEKRRVYRKKGWKYLLDDEDCTAWIAKGHIGRCRRFRVPDHVEIEDVRYTITSIELGAFKSQKTLRHLVIPDSINYVDEDVFCFFPNLRSVYLGKNVRHIDDWHFRSNPRLTNLNISKDNPYIKVAGNLILTGDGKTVLRTLDNYHRHATYEIPEGVEHIYERAFWENPKLTEIHLPSTVKTLGNNAFSCNPNLRSVVLNDGLEKIDTQCFMDCENLEYIEFPSSLKTIGYEAFDYCPNLKSMDKFYHGTSVLFDRFDLSHVGEGEGKTKYGFGVNVTESVATAALYARKYSAADVTTHYIYTLKVPTIEDGNHYWSALPVPQGIIERAEAKLGETIPDEAKNAGKLFRKYIGNRLIGNNTPIKKMIGAASLEAEKAASAFLLSIGVEMLVWPQSQTKPDGLQNRLIYDVSKIKIVKIEQVSYDEKGKYLPGSEKEVIF